MDWNELWTNFTLGKSDAVQAIVSIASFIATGVGIIYVAKSFRQQKNINLMQNELNRLALEKDKRELFPWFSGRETYLNDFQTEYKLILKDNKATNVEVFPLDEIGARLNPLYPPSQVVMPDATRGFINLRVTNADQENGAVFRPQFQIYYEDENGRPYTQDIGHNGNKVVVLYPQDAEQ
jgi:hypothetical protein